MGMWGGLQHGASANGYYDVIITIMSNMFSNMAVALYMPTLNLAMHPRAGRGQHNHPPFGSFWL